MLLAAFVYLLLISRVRLWLCAAADGQEASAYALAQLWGIRVCMRACAAQDKTELYRRFSARRSGGFAQIKRLWHHAGRLLGVCRVEEVRLHLCLGLDLAQHTALAAGFARAGAAALFSRLPQETVCRCAVEAEYGKPCFRAYARCIFSASVGDIIFALAKAMIAQSAGKRERHGKASH